MLHPSVDQYIEKSAEFARPILSHFRTLIHKSGNGIVEELKWGMPCFIYKKKIVANMAAFKHHAAIGFWYASLLNDDHGILAAKEGMGSLGKLTSLEQLPDAMILSAYIQESLALIDAGKTVQRTKTDQLPIEIPTIVTEAFKLEPIAKQNFDTLSPSHKKEYIDWIIGAKQEATVIRRLEKMIENLNQRKTKEWKHAK